jgi:hypothetical protein
MMARVAVKFGELVVEMEELDDFWAMRSQLEIPLAHVRGAAVAPALASVARQLEERVAVLGTGSIVEQEGNLFWDVRDPERAVVITLAHARYHRLVVEVDDPIRVVANINRSLDSEHG